jgi:hypothetical protein
MTIFGIIMDRKKFIKNIGAVAALSTISDLHSAVDKLENSFSASVNGKLLLIHINDSIPNFEIEKFLLAKLKSQLTAYDIAFQTNVNVENLQKLITSDLKKKFKNRDLPLIAIRPHLKEAFGQSVKGRFFFEYTKLTNTLPNNFVLINPYSSTLNNGKRLDSRVMEFLKAEVNNSHAFYVELNDFVLYKTNKELFYKRLNINMDELVTVINSSNENSTKELKNQSEKNASKVAFERIVMVSNLTAENNGFIIDLQLKK